MKREKRAQIACTRSPRFALGHYAAIRLQRARASSHKFESLACHRVACFVSQDIPFAFMLSRLAKRAASNCFRMNANPAHESRTTAHCYAQAQSMNSRRNNLPRLDKEQ